MENFQRMLRVQIVDTPFRSETGGIRGFQSFDPSVNRTAVKQYHIGVSVSGWRRSNSARLDLITTIATQRAIKDSHISAQLPPLLISDNPQLTPLDRSVYEDQNNRSNLKNFIFLLPTAILLALGATKVGYGLYCCPQMQGVLLILFAAVPISAAVWCFFFRVLGI